MFIYLSFRLTSESNIMSPGDYDGAEPKVAEKGSARTDFFNAPVYFLVLHSNKRAKFATGATN